MMQLSFIQARSGELVETISQGLLARPFQVWNTLTVAQYTASGVTKLMQECDILLL